MPKFKKKEIKRQKTLGERLKKAREESNISLEQIENETQIRKKHIIALEEGNYDDLPGEIYIKKFLKKYAEYLGVNTEMVLSIFQKEERAYPQDLKDVSLKPKTQKLPKSFVSPKIIRNFLIILIILVCLFYLGYELRQILAPPSLEIIYPPDNLTIKEYSIDIEGKTDKESTVLINNQSVFLDRDGKFKENIELQDGLNTITIISRKKEGKEITIQRNIFVESDAS